MPVTFKKCMARCQCDTCITRYAEENQVLPFCLNATLFSTDSLSNKYFPNCLVKGFWKKAFPGNVHPALEPVGTFKLPIPHHTEGPGDPLKYSQTSAIKKLPRIMFQMGIRETKITVSMHLKKKKRCFKVDSMRCLVEFSSG